MDIKHTKRAGYHNPCGFVTVTLKSRSHSYYRYYDIGPKNIAYENLTTVVITKVLQVIHHIHTYIM